MTTKLEQAARQALEALGRIHFAATELDRRNRVRWFDDAVNEAKEAITALREALAEPQQYNHETGSVLIPNPLAEQAEQEPVAWMHTFAGDVQINNLPAECYGDHWTRTPLYAAPVRTKDLTDDEIAKLWSPHRSEWENIRAVIAADREKNK